jgi:hypothetical protein
MGLSEAAGKLTTTNPAVLGITAAAARKNLAGAGISFVPADFLCSSSRDRCVSE